VTAGSQLLDGETLQVLKGVVPPLAVATPLLFLAWRPWRGRAAVTDGGAWGASLGLALGFFAAYVYVKGYWPPFPAVSGTDWFPYIGVLVAVVTLCIRAPSGHLWRPTVVLAILASWQILRTMWVNRWDGGAEGLLHVGISATVLVVLSLGLAPLGSRSRGPLLPLVLTLTCSVTGFVLFAGSGASMGQLAGALASVLGVCTALGFWNRQFTLHRSGALVVAMLLGCLLVGGHYFNNSPPLPSALVALAPLCAWVDRWEVVAARTPLVRAGVVLGTVAVPLAVAGWLAWQTLAQYEY
jgi:hypothetical protein